MIRQSLSFSKRGLRAGFVLGSALSLLFLGLSFVLPTIVPSRYYQRSLGVLRKQAQSIKKEFTALESAVENRQRLLLSLPFPTDRNEVFLRFKELKITPEIEGVAYYDEDGELAIWLGNALDFRPSAETGSLVVRNKGSVYLVTSQKIRQSESVVLFQLIAFLPQIKAPYLQEYHFVRPRLRRNCHIDYWDFREDVSGFEKIFGRHKDEYIGQPRLQDEIQTIFFPLRNKQKEIIATVNLSSPSLLSSQTKWRDGLISIFTVLLMVSLVLLVIDLAKSYLFVENKKALPVLILIVALVGLRLIFFSLGRLENIQKLSPFSPATAAFVSVKGLTQSPADIFLSVIFLFLIIGCLALPARDLFKEERPKLSIPVTWLINMILISLSFFSLWAFERTVSQLILNSSVNLLRFKGSLSFLLLHLSLIFLLLCFFLVISLCLRAVHHLSRRLGEPLVLLASGFIVYLAFFNTRNNLLWLILPAVAMAGLFVLTGWPHLLKKREIAFAAFILSVLFLYLHLHENSMARRRSLLQHFLPNTIVSQENWAEFLLRQSIPELEKRQDSILLYLQNPGTSIFARSLWENTLVSKFNWYSTLEVLNGEGEILSRFSLNIPQLYRPDLTLPLSQRWEVSRLAIPSLGKEREFVLGYKDWFFDQQYLGRLIFSLAVDPEMLPFLYSANPYFELLKVSSLPSLHQEEFGFVIFDAKGKIVFNPNHLFQALPGKVLALIDRSPDAVWSLLEDREQKYEAFFFQLNNRIYSLFMRRKSAITFAVEFLKLLFFYLGLVFFFGYLVPALLGKTGWKKAFWSFSSRVYAAFAAITLICLFLFSLFSHNFFSRVFSQRFIEKAEIHANFARNVMQDFIFLQQEERATLIAPTDDLVLWISSAIANDVSLYREGRLVSSSRREFFDWGLLPELIDGETHYKIRHENRPFYTQRQKIGSYSLQTLTIPYTILQSQFLISLPFPFEEQEIAKATEELVEFLVLISVFFIALTLLLARGVGQMIILPVKKLLAGTREVSLGNLEISVEHKSHDEMKTLIDGFNAMIQNLKKHQQEIAELSKKVAWAEIAQKVAHEVKNPLTPIQLSAEHLLRVYEDKGGDMGKAIKESASYIISEVQNLRRIAQEFLELSRVSSLNKELFDLKEVVEEVVSPYKKMLSERIRFHEVYEGGEFPLNADKSKIKIAFRNIFINAIEAIRGKGNVEIRLASEKECLVLEVKDTGIGMAKDLLEKIFDPYFSTKDVGTGLGLPIAKKIIEDHGGTIMVESKIHEGTRIAITLPRELRQ